jgi:hypothetical protein
MNKRWLKEIKNSIVFLVGLSAILAFILGLGRLVNVIIK